MQKEHSVEALIRKSISALLCKTAGLIKNLRREQMVKARILTHGGYAVSVQYSYSPPAAEYSLAELRYGLLPGTDHGLPHLNDSFNSKCLIKIDIV